MKISAKMRETGSVLASPFIYQLMRISVITTIILLTSLQLLLATSTRGQNMYTDRVNLSLRGESLSAALTKIEEQTKLRFFFRNSDIKSISSLDLSAGNRTVEETLNALVANTFLSFKQIGANILLQRNQQQAYEVRGLVVGEDRRPVALANIVLRKTANSRVLLEAQADGEGRFKLTVAEKGNYRITFSAIGMDELSVAFELKDAPLVELPDVLLSPSNTTLTEVVVVSKKPYIEQKIDRTIVNVGAIISNAGANALQALEKAPGIIVDQNGNISFKGKTGVTILIDDKPTYLSGDNLANFLKSLPASQLEQVELMTNPPAKYEASGNAGVINIKTKKGKATGFNGSVSANIGHANFLRTGESLILNYRTAKANFFSSVGYNAGKQFNTIDLQRNYFDAGGQPLSIYQEQASLQPNAKNTSLKFGADFYTSAKTTLGIVYTGALSSIRRYNPVNSKLFNGQGLLDSTITAENYRKIGLNNHGVNFNYGHQFADAGRSLTFDMDYVRYNNKTNDTFLNNTYFPNGQLFSSQSVTDDLPTGINIYSAKSDYTHPLKNKAKVESGIKTSYVNTDNAANYFNVVNNVSSIDNGKTNQFLYKENINGAYFNFSQEFKRFSIQAGLRLENTNVKGHQLGNALKPDSSFNNHYTNLFPTTYFLYKLDSAANNVLNFSIGRRVDRPFYQDLNPFITVIDKYTYFSGNPFLKPQYAYNYEFTYSHKSGFSATAFYNNYKNFQTETIQQNDGVFISRTSNIGQKITKGVSASTSFSASKWWDLNLYTEVVNFIYRGQVYGSYLNSNSTYFYLQANNQFNLSKGWSAELSGFYFTSRIVGQFNLDAKSQLSAGIQKKVLNNKGSVRLTARDIFLQNISSGSLTNIPQTTSDYRTVSDSRVVLLGFSYNFGNTGKQKRNTGAAQSEQNRIKQ